MSQSFFFTFYDRLAPPAAWPISTIPLGELHLSSGVFLLGTSIFLERFPLEREETIPLPNAAPIVIEHQGRLDVVGQRRHLLVRRRRRADSRGARPRAVRRRRRGQRRAPRWQRGEGAVSH